MNVYAVQKRTGNFRPVAVNLLVATATCVFGIGEIAAGASMQYTIATYHPYFPQGVIKSLYQFPNSFSINIIQKIQ